MNKFLYWFVEMGGSISDLMTVGLFPDYGGFELMAKSVVY